MVNYYDLLGLSQGASEDDIRAKLKQRKRVWTQRQNAPKPQQQQEATKNLRMVPEIEATLLDLQKRAAYDQQLRAAPRHDSQLNSRNFQASDLIKEGWRLLSIGNLPDALMVATKATRVQGNNPDARALLGYCKAQWGETSDAIYEYKRAIQLRPNDASLYFDLGGIYEGIEQWKDAMRQYERAAQIDPHKTVYRAAMGSVFIKNELYIKGIDILETCIREEPGNDGYKYLLAMAYADSGYQNWTLVEPHGHIPPGFYATTSDQVAEAEDLIDKADAVGASDPDLNRHLAEVRENIAAMRKRRFHGNLLAAGAALVVGLLILCSGQPDMVPGAFYFLICGWLYIVSCRTPQYNLNKRLIEGKTDTSWGFISEMGSDGGCFGAVFAFLIILVFLPVMTLWNFARNYAAS